MHGYCRCWSVQSFWAIIAVREREMCLHVSFYEKGERWTKEATYQDKGRQQFIFFLGKDLSSQMMQTKQTRKVPISDAAIWLRGTGGQPAQVGLKPSSSN